MKIKSEKTVAANPQRQTRRGHCTHTHTHTNAANWMRWASRCKFSNLMNFSVRAQQMFVVMIAFVLRWCAMETSPMHFTDSKSFIHIHWRDTDLNNRRMHMAISEYMKYMEPPAATIIYVQRNWMVAYSICLMLLQMSSIRPTDRFDRPNQFTQMKCRRRRRHKADKYNSQSVINLILQMVVCGARPAVNAAYGTNGLQITWHAWKRRKELSLQLYSLFSGALHIYSNDNNNIWKKHTHTEQFTTSPKSSHSFTFLF